MHHFHGKSYGMHILSDAIPGPGALLIVACREGGI